MACKHSTDMQELVDSNRRLLEENAELKRNNAVLFIENERLLNKNNRILATMRRVHWITVKAWQEATEPEPNAWRYRK
jgi:hypothetical protein